MEAEVSEVLKMADIDIAQAYVRYFLEGADSHFWAVEELGQLAIDAPLRAWHIIMRINATPIEDESWRAHLRKALGCGALEDLLVLHESAMLPVILSEAATDVTLQSELSTIYENSVSPDAWSRIKDVLANISDVN